MSAAHLIVDEAESIRERVWPLIARGHHAAAYLAIGMLLGELELRNRHLNHEEVLKLLDETILKYLRTKGH